MTIPDDFTNRVANLSGDTVRMLEHIMPLLEDEGFVGAVDMCQQFIEKHTKLAYDCAVITQNIEMPKE
jgi:hypothetical protein